LRNKTNVGTGGMSIKIRSTKLTLPLLLTLIISGVCSAEPLLPDGRRFRQIVADKYPTGVYIGGTTGWRKRSNGAGVTMDREFSYVTPENDFKQRRIHPQPNIWNWTEADAWVEHCRKQQQILRIHGPIGPQCSAWAKRDNRTAGELRQNLIEFMTALCQRYDKHPHVKWMDVVNETVLQSGKWHHPKNGTEKWENPWLLLGNDTSHTLNPPLYIKLAFELANKNAPNTDLIINQHGGMEKLMWEKIKALVSYLRQHNLRVDGIGWQAHIDVGWEQEANNMKQLDTLIDWAHDNQLSFHVTENNVWLRDDEKNYQAQAQTFEAILRLLLKKRNGGVVTWNVWNLSDRDSWKKKMKLEGCLFDRNYRAKPAYYALQQVLENPPQAD